ncbi:MAG: EutP/PduV family microcompartment system protein [Lachnospirales bacterium]
MKKIILIGKRESGKTTLIQRLLSNEVKYKKTQAIDIQMNFIDTPGEYLENKMFYKALIVTAVEADIIGFIEDCTSDEKWIPPLFSTTFSKETIGIVTKIDKGDYISIKNAEERLTEAGCSKIFKISALEKIGMLELKEYLTNN